MTLLPNGDNPASGGGIVAYFGYGSLVCRATHRTEIVAAVPARLKGWRRLWRPRPDMPGFPAALLSVRPQHGAACDGLLVFDRAENLASVDAREACYRRVALSSGDLVVNGPAAFDCPLYLYVAEEDVPPHPEPPAILRSYLEAVLLGFLREHGEGGVSRFIAETEGFGTGLHDDSHAPIYPRAVALEAAERDLVEDLLRAGGILPLDLRPIEG